MDWNLYLKDGIEKKVFLDFGDYIFDNSNVSENFDNNEITNPTGDLVFGTVSIPQLSFSIEDVYHNIPDSDVSGKDFTYSAGLNTDTKSFKDLYKLIKQDIVCIGINVAYAGNEKVPFLNIFDLTGKKLLAPEQPILPVKSLVLVNGKLYCGHDKLPYLTVYNVDKSSLIKQPDVSLNPFYIKRITEYYNKKNVSFSVLKSTLKEYRVTKLTQLIDGVLNTTLIDFEEKTFEFFKIGHFIAEKAERINDTSISVKARGRMSKFDKVIDDWSATVVYPITTGNLLKSLCTYVGVPLKTPDFLNSRYVVYDDYFGTQVNGTQIIGWVAQLAACFAVMDENGSLCIQTYQNRGCKIKEDSYTEVKVLGYSTALIEKVQIKTTENDIGGIYPDDKTKTNALVIEGNMLVNTLYPDELKTLAESIYNAVKDISYTPFSIKTIWADPRRKAGDIFLVETKGGQIIQSFIMSCKTKGINALEGEYICTGNKTRSQKVSAINQEIVRIRGKTNEIISNVDRLDVTLTEVKSKTDSNSSQLLVQANQIALKSNQTTVDALTGRVFTAESSITAQAAQIALKVSQVDYNGNTIASLINQTATEILIQASKINLVGYVTATDLMTGNLTVNGKFLSISEGRSVEIQNASIQLGYVDDPETGTGGGFSRITHGESQHGKPTMLIESGRHLSSESAFSGNIDMRANGTLYLSTGGWGPIRLASGGGGEVVISNSAVWEDATGIIWAGRYAARGQLGLNWTITIGNIRQTFAGGILVKVEDI